MADFTVVKKLSQIQLELILKNSFSLEVKKIKLNLQTPIIYSLCLSVHFCSEKSENRWSIHCEMDRAVACCQLSYGMAVV